MHTTTEPDRSSFQQSSSDRHTPTHLARLPGGAALAYIDEGAGDPLLFVHGWACDARDFAEQLAHFRVTHRVIAPDLRGHGRSAVVDAGDDAYDARVFARDLVELLDTLRIGGCVAIGHSLGALVVSILAVEYPERVRGVVSLEPSRVQVVPAGHWVQQDAPELVNRAIEAWLAELTVIAA